MRVIILVCLALLLLPSFASAEYISPEALQMLKTASAIISQEHEKTKNQLIIVENILMKKEDLSQRQKILIEKQEQQLNEDNERLIERKQLIEKLWTSYGKLKTEINDYRAEAEGIIADQQTVIIIGGIGAGVIIIALTVALIAK